MQMQVTLRETHRPRNQYEQNYLYDDFDSNSNKEKGLYVYAFSNNGQSDFTWMTLEELQTESYYIYVIKTGFEEVVCVGEAYGAYIEKNFLNGVYSGMTTIYRTDGEEAIHELDWSEM